MFAHGDAMHLSTANLLIVSQQLPRGVQQAPPPEAGQFALSPKQESSAVGANTFVPSEFAEASLPTHVTVPPPPENSIRRQPGPLGARIDIRV